MNQPEPGASVHSSPVIKTVELTSEQHAAVLTALINSLCSQLGSAGGKEAKNRMVDDLSRQAATYFDGALADKVPNIRKEFHAEAMKTTAPDAGRVYGTEIGGVLDARLPDWRTIFQEAVEAVVESLQPILHIPGFWFEESTTMDPTEVATCTAHLQALLQKLEGLDSIEDVLKAYGEFLRLPFVSQNNELRLLFDNAGTNLTRQALDQIK